MGEVSVSDTYWIPVSDTYWIQILLGYTHTYPRSIVINF